MNDIERIQSILVTLLEAAYGKAAEARPELSDTDLKAIKDVNDEIAEAMHDDLMKRITNQSDDAVGLIARRLVEVANHE